MPESKEGFKFIPNIFNSLLSNPSTYAKQTTNDEVMEKLLEISLQISELEMKFERVFGAHALIDSRFVNLLKKEKK
jgi:hypothetical protein